MVKDGEGSLKWLGASISGGDEGVVLGVIFREARIWLDGKWVFYLRTLQNHLDTRRSGHAITYGRSRLA
jgi:hypothetical protein